MDQEARAELLRRNREAQEELQRDMKARRERRLSGDDINPPPRPTPTVTSQREDETYEEARLRKLRAELFPALPQQREVKSVCPDERWNRWFAESFKLHMRRHIKDINKTTKDIEKTFAVAAGKREKLREEMREEMRVWIKSKNREFKLEVDLMNELMIKRVSEDLNIMRADMMKVLRKEIMDEMQNLLNISNVTPLHGKVGK